MFLLFDIGASRTRWATASKSNQLGRVTNITTPQSFANAKDIFTRIGKSLPARAKAVFLGLPGNLNSTHTKLNTAPHLRDWKGRNIAKELSKIFKTKVFLENDTALVGLGEAVRGAGNGRSLVAYVTVSTGVNGVRIVDGQIDRNAMGFEIGHHIISVLGQRAYTLEEFISGSALEARSKLQPKNIIDKTLWRDVERYLAYGLANVVRFWSPEIIVLGGGVVMSGKIKLSKVSSLLTGLIPEYEGLPKVVPARLGDSAGLLGALEYLSKLK